jgi:hypothetical protein
VISVKRQIRILAAALTLVLVLAPLMSMRAKADTSITLTVGQSYDKEVYHTDELCSVDTVSGSLPPGMDYSYSMSGISIYGTPTTPGTYSQQFYTEEVYGGHMVQSGTKITVTVKPAPTPEPAKATPVPKVEITKDPTDEVVQEGGSCKFVGKAENASKSVWHFVSPDGKTDVNYSKIAKTFPNLDVSGGSGNTLKLGNIPYAMDGWSVYCRYSNGDDNYAKTEPVSLTVIPKSAIVTATPAPTATPTATPTAVPTPEPVSEPDPPAAPEQTPEPSEPAMGPTDTPILPGGTGGSNQNAGTLDRLLPIIIIAGAAVLIVVTICITLIVLSKNRRRGRRN